MQSVLEERSIESSIYVEYLDARLAGRLKLIGSCTPRPDDLLLIHHSMGHDLLPWLDALPCRKLLSYHNITPPDFFPPESPLHRYTKLGLQQLQALRGMVKGAMADSEFNAQELTRRGFSDVRVVPILRDFGPFRSAPFAARWHYFEKPRYQLLFVGRICENKGQLELIRFMERYADSFEHPLHLTLVGRFDHGVAYGQKLRAAVDEAGLQDRVFFAGFVSEEDLCGHYRAADAYVSFSEHEGFGVPLIEAMSLDVPVLAYDVAAITSTLGPAGIKLHSKASEELARQLHKLFSDREYRRGVVREQRKRLQAFDRDHVSQQFMEFLAPHLPRSVGGARKPAAPASPAKATKRRRYLIEGACETSYSLAIVNRCLGLALDDRPDAGASFQPMEGIEGYVLDKEAARRHPGLLPLVGMPKPAPDETIVTIRDTYPPRPAGMLGDYKLAYFFWEETEVPSAFVRLFNRYLDGIIAPTKFGKTVYRNSGIRVPISIGGVGVDHRSTVDRRPRTAAPTRPFTFLHVSSGLARKGIEELFLAYAMAFTARDNVELVVKTYRNATNVVSDWYDRLIAGRPNAPAVRLLFADLTDEDMSELLDMADAVVLPTRGEGFNLPAAEAMALGIPVVTTNHSAHLDFCNASNAHLIDFDFEHTESHVGGRGAMWVRTRVPDLASKLRSLADKRTSDEERRSANARDSVRQLRWDVTAQNVELFVDELDRGRPEKVGLKVAWVSTWNTRCGIATYSEFLINAMPDRYFDITILANQNKSDRPDEPNVFRCWTDRAHPLDDLLKHILDNNYDVAVFQYAYGFHSLTDLGETVARLEGAGVSCYVFLHKTAHAIIDGQVHSLKDIRQSLEKATRLIVHSVEDVNRLKQFGFVDNVLKLPHGAHRSTSLNKDVLRRSLSLHGRQPVIASYGFLLPNKGIQELIAAFSLLRARHPDALLLLVNAIYPDPISDAERAGCAELIAQLGLTDSVALIDGFLDDDESMMLVQAADVVVFPYQHTEESASGAVRYGLSSLRPVLTTPLSIFDDVQSLVHQCKGVSPIEISEGIEAILDNREIQDRLIANQTAWLEENCWERVGERFSNTVVGLFEDRAAVAVIPRSNSGAPPAAPPTTIGNAVLERLSPEALVKICYQRFLGRDPEAGGPSVHVGLISSGAKRRDEVLYDILNSSEGRAFSKCALTDAPIQFISFEELDRGTDEEFINDVYTRLLDRQADDDGKAHFLQILKEGKLNRRQVLGEFACSDEFLRLDRPIRIV